MLKEARPYSSASGKQPAWRGNALALRQPLPCLQPSNKHDYETQHGKVFPPHRWMRMEKIASGHCPKNN